MPGSFLYSNFRPTCSSRELRSTAWLSGGEIAVPSTRHRTPPATPGPQKRPAGIESVRWTLSGKLWKPTSTTPGPHFAGYSPAGKILAHQRLNVRNASHDDAAIKLRALSIRHDRPH